MLHIIRVLSNHLSNLVFIRDSQIVISALLCLLTAVGCVLLVGKRVHLELIWRTFLSQHLNKEFIVIAIVLSVV